MNIDKEALVVAIAEKLGWQWWKFKGIKSDGEPPLFFSLVKPGRSWPPAIGGVLVDKPSNNDVEITDAVHWTTDLNAAWQLVEWMRKEENGGFSFAIESLTGGGWWVMIYDEESPMTKSYPADDEKPEMAICKAFCFANSIPIPQLTT